MIAFLVVSVMFLVAGLVLLTNALGLTQQIANRNAARERAGKTMHGDYVSDLRDGRRIGALLAALGAVGLIVALAM